MSHWVVVGRFGRAHGIKGYISVHSFTEPKDNLLQYKHWHAWINKQWQAISLIDSEARPNGLIAKIKGYEDRDSVARLVNLEIAVPSEDIPPSKPGEYYCYELIGMEVVNKQGQAFGKVVQVLPTGANDVLVIEGEKRHMVPFILDHYVLEVNTEQRLITVDWDYEF